ncbi:MAG: L-threonylcarbamoyladenylate synthase [Candidatus Omnitrophota bacterium]
MNPTRIIKVDPLKISEDYILKAVDILKSGGLVILPTETVYGIAADALNKEAVERLAEIKKRPKDKPFTLAIDSKEKVEEFCREIPLAAYKLMDKFWPGPLTLVLKGVSQPTIGLRLPDNAVALKIISLLGNPVVLPSANLSGGPSPENFAAAIQGLDGLVDLAIDSGDLELGVESTVVDLTAQIPRVIRSGAINAEEINKAISRKNILFVCTGNTCRSVIAEGLFRKMMREQKRDDVEVSSAGITALAGMGASQAAREALAREGIDVSAHLARAVTSRALKRSDLILVMEKAHEAAVLQVAPEVKNRVFLLKEFAKIDDSNLDIIDPMGRPLDFYEQTFASIREALERVSKLI